ncbi:hypothetical protein WR25_09611 [Diploscapter pachys]|uniref:Uncharacterized protein n=1 Tax=Diploscapter pachys TaxID=2018661 RepID=A0A2A2K491_9BILA|nr:hypothetical protein WR25_09611 [Diploscapter pachys]
MASELTPFKIADLLDSEAASQEYLSQILAEVEPHWRPSSTSSITALAISLIKCAPQPRLASPSVAASKVMRFTQAMIAEACSMADFPSCPVLDLQLAQCQFHQPACGLDFVHRCHGHTARCAGDLGKGVLVGDGEGAEQTFRDLDEQVFERVGCFGRKRARVPGFACLEYFDRERSEKGYKCDQYQALGQVQGLGRWRADFCELCQPSGLSGGHATVLEALQKERIAKSEAAFQ